MLLRGVAIQISYMKKKKRNALIIREIQKCTILFSWVQVEGWVGVSAKILTLFIFRKRYGKNGRFLIQTKLHDIMRVKLIIFRTFIFSKIHVRLFTLCFSFWLHCILTKGYYCGDGFFPCVSFFFKCNPLKFYRMMQFSSPDCPMSCGLFSLD